jgi:hypothetical protein
MKGFTSWCCLAVAFCLLSLPMFGATQFLYTLNADAAPNYTSSTISQWTVNASTGNLTLGSTYAAGDNVNGAYGRLATITTGSNTCLYAGLLATGTFGDFNQVVSAFKVNLTTGALTAVSGSPFNTGFPLVSAFGGLIATMTDSNQGYHLYAVDGQPFYTNEGPGLHAVHFTVNSDCSLSSSGAYTFSTGFDTLNSGISGLAVDQNHKLVVSAVNGGTSGNVGQMLLLNESGGAITLNSVYDDTPYQPYAVVYNPNNNEYYTQEENGEVNYLTISSWTDSGSIGFGSRMTFYEGDQNLGTNDYLLADCGAQGNGNLFAIYDPSALQLIKINISSGNELTQLNKLTFKETEAQRAGQLAVDANDTWVFAPTGTDNDNNNWVSVVTIFAFTENSSSPFLGKKADWESAIAVPARVCFSSNN